jgi:predicted ATPase
MGDYSYGDLEGFCQQLLLRDGAVRRLSEWPSLPQPTGDWQQLTENPLIAEQLDYDRAQLQAELDIRLGKLNEEQRVAYNRITSSVNNQDGQSFFLNGPGGTGKTFVYNTVCTKLRGDGKITLCVSSSGISALLLRGGRTAHSVFKIPIDNLHEHSVCAIPKNSDRAELTRATSAIIWDEIGVHILLAACPSEIDHSRRSRQWQGV